MHERLYAELMVDLGLDPEYGRYVDAVGAETLAAVNLSTLLALHRRLRGALVGHFAVVEVTSPPAAARLVEAMRRTGAGPAAERYYDEHVEADAVHEQLVRREAVGGLLEDEPDLAPDVALGIAATGFLEDRLGAHVLESWEHDRARCGLRSIRWTRPGDLSRRSVRSRRRLSRGGRGSVRGRRPRTSSLLGVVAFGGLAGPQLAARHGRPTLPGAGGVVDACVFRRRARGGCQRLPSGAGPRFQRIRDHGRARSFRSVTSRGARSSIRAAPPCRAWTVST